MSNVADWVRAFARQADADYRAWELYEKHPSALAAECHKLLFLQMACEKLCKAYLVKTGTQLESIGTSHAYIAKPLPIVIKAEITFGKNNLKKMHWVLRHVRQMAGEIELLNPSVKRAGQRTDNCEYPWELNGTVFSPLDHSFAPSKLLDAPAGRTFLKLLQMAIDRLLKGDAAN